MCPYNEIRLSVVCTTVLVSYTRTGTVSFCAVGLRAASSSSSRSSCKHICNKIFFYTHFILINFILFICYNLYILNDQKRGMYAYIFSVFFIFTLQCHLHSIVIYTPLSFTLHCHLHSIIIYTPLSFALHCQSMYYSFNIELK